MQDNVIIRVKTVVVKLVQNTTKKLNNKPGAARQQDVRQDYDDDNDDKWTGVWE